MAVSRAALTFSAVLFLGLFVIMSRDTSKFVSDHSHALVALVMGAALLAVVVAMGGWPHGG